MKVTSDGATLWMEQPVT